VTFEIFFKDFKVAMQIEEPLYTIEKLFSEIGGAAGLFLGCRYAYARLGSSHQRKFTAVGD